MTNTVTSITICYEPQVFFQNRPGAFWWQGEELTWSLWREPEKWKQHINLKARGKGDTQSIPEYPGQKQRRERKEKKGKNESVLKVKAVL